VENAGMLGLLRQDYFIFRALSVTRQTT
jgi:hypothetical protein